MKVIAKLDVWSLCLLSKLVFIRIGGNLFGIHDSCWELGWTSPTEIAVGLMVGEVLDLSLVQIGGVLCHCEMYRKSCSCVWIHIGNHVKVKELWSITLDDDLVN